MDANTNQCPGCGKSAAGNFCSHCGTPLLTKCPPCGRDVEPGSRACSQCGAALTARAAPARSITQLIMPWVALGFAVVALMTALSAKYDQGPNAVPSMPMQMPGSAPAASAPAGTPPDLSTMSPREAADRLFNRVMTAKENGNAEEAQRFAPMALQAYERAGATDNDARYHLALIYLVAGDLQGARAQLARLRQAVPNHLLGYMLESDIAEQSGNAEGVAKAYKGFLAAYASEMPKAREEYQDHHDSIERFRAEAQAGRKPAP